MKTATIELPLRIDGTTVAYSQIFKDSTAIGLFLKKSKEWIFPIYRTDLDAKLCGYIYEGTTISFLEIAQILTLFAPKTLSDLADYKTKHAAKVEYRTIKIESFQIIGQYADRDVMVKK